MAAPVPDPPDSRMNPSEIPQNRRDSVSFDPRFFEKQKSDPSLESQFQPGEDVFHYIYRTKHWAGIQSVSGPGSDQEQTGKLGQELPHLFIKWGIRSLLDLPCGDFGWMQSVGLPIERYVGGDIVPELIALNKERYGNRLRTFQRLDMRWDPLPTADCLLCRDAWVHLSFDDLSAVLQNIHRQDIRYLLATTFPETERNEDIPTGDWRPLNLCRPPFHFPEPLELLNEGCTEGNNRFLDKSLGLWRIQDLPCALETRLGP